MFSIPYLCICLYCMMQLVFFIVMENRRRNAWTGQDRYFLWMISITLFSFAADICSSLYKGPVWFFPFAAAGNYFEVVLNATLIPLFFRYICTQVYDLNPALKRRVGALLWAMTFFGALLVASTAFTGLIFYFDSARVYHRGPLFFAAMSLFFVMMAVVEVFLVSQRQKIDESYYKSLIFFLAAPLAGWALQTLFFGLPFSLFGITFAAQIVFTNIQNLSMDKDYLTGAFTRQTLDRYLQNKIDASDCGKTFSAVMLDIDSFKSINDRFGHYEGDSALIGTVRLIRAAVGRKGFIARYGGDEFCVILGNGDPAELERVIHKIGERLRDYNAKSGKPYLLSFSMGYSVYLPSLGGDARAFFQVIDRKMYDVKNSRRGIDLSEREQPV